jgi:hypothetical protein
MIDCLIVAFLKNHLTLEAKECSSHIAMVQYIKPKVKFEMFFLFTDVHTENACISQVQKQKEQKIASFLQYSLKPLFTRVIEE